MDYKYYQDLLPYLEGYTVQGLFAGSRSIQDIVTVQTGNKGRIFFFDQEPMFSDLDRELWDHVFQEPTIFANSELNSNDKQYLEQNYPNFIDWYFFSNALLSLEWFDSQRDFYAGWNDYLHTVLDCNLITGSRQYRVYLMYLMYKRGFQRQSHVSFNGEHNWIDDLNNYDEFNLLNAPEHFLKRIPTEKISYDDWGKQNKRYNTLMQSRLPLEHYSQVNYITVTETLCVENKQHLSEKAFKPIAAGKPFLLAAGVNNLEYLRSYGFETFSDCWDESYDSINDPKQRLDTMFQLMEYNLNMSVHYMEEYKEGSVEWQQELDLIPQKLNRLRHAHSIAQRNREYFWSSKFKDRVFGEALDNLEKAKAVLASKNI